jgi:chitodextrinase
VGYNVYANDAFKFSVAGTNAQVTGLAAGERYQLTVKAYDAAGNKSEASSALEVTAEQSTIEHGQYGFRSQFLCGSANVIKSGGPYASTQACYAGMNSIPGCNVAENTTPTCSCDKPASEQSGCSDLAPHPIPFAPTGLKSTGHTSTSVSLAWTASASATGYNVYVNGNPVAAASSAGTTATVNGLSAGSTAKFIVKARNDNGESGPSNEVSVTLDPLATGSYVWQFKFEYWTSQALYNASAPPSNTSIHHDGPFTTGDASCANEQSAYTAWKNNIESHSAGGYVFADEAICLCNKPASEQGSACTF